MKKLITSCLSAILILIVFSGKSSAQKVAHINLTAPVVIATTAASATMLNQKAFSSFMLLHPAATDQRWFKVEKYFLVKYILDEKPGRVLYTDKGKIVYEINYGTKKDLDAAVQKLVQNKYSEYDITSAIKVNQYNKDIWFVTVANDKSFILLRYEDEQIFPGEVLAKNL